MKLKIIACVFFGISCYFANSQNQYKPIYIDLIKDYYLPYNLEHPDTIELSGKKFFVIKLIDVKGEFSFVMLKNKKIIAEGKYCNSLDLFKRYGEIFDVDGKSKIEIEEYYYPLKDSVWKVMDDRSLKYKIIKYDKGILVK